jgi:hypothetical protein
MAANIANMPARGHLTAPKFLPDQPRKLKCYFRELKILLASAGITDEDKKKKHASRYLNVDSAEL